MGKIEIKPELVKKMAKDFQHEASQLENMKSDLNNDMNSAIWSLETGANYSPKYLSAVRTAMFTHDNAMRLGNSLNNKIHSVSKYAEESAEKAIEADKTLSDRFREYTKGKGTIDYIQDYLSMKGNIIGAITAGKISLNGLFFNMTGLTSFVKEEGKWVVKNNGTYKALADAIDNSRFRKLGRAIVNPKSLYKFKDIPLNDLLYQKKIGFHPKSLAEFTNGVQDYKKSLKRAANSKSFFKTAIKDSGELIKAGKGFAKANVVSSLLITAGGASINMGLDIVKNYRKYENNPEKLKTENAKAVGRAVNTTVVQGTFTAGGAVIGGAVGSFLGPVGTVAGSAIGSYVGSIVGGKVAKYTAGFAEDMAVKFKEPINSGIEKVKDGLEAIDKGLDAFESGVKSTVDTVKETASNVKDGFKKVGDHVSSMLDGAKHLFSF